jgi:hypothetical protein
MKIKGKIKGDMIGFSLKHNPDNGTRFANVRILTGCDRDSCKAVFGEELERVAFGSMRISKGGEKDGPAGVSFGYKRLEPEAICEYHEIEIVGTRQNCQPVIKSISPVKDKAEVCIAIEIPILIKKNKSLAGSLVAEFGELVTVGLNPAQRELPLDGQNGDGEGAVIQRGAFGNPKAVTAEAR